MTGTKNNVETVANNRPPMTARPKGAFCSAPSPHPKAMGIMPMIMASAVINTGLMRVAPASRAALTGSKPSFMRWRAKDTIKMLLAVATPMVMMAPVNAGTLKVVAVRNSIQQIPASAAGKAVMMMKASIQDWKFTTINKYTMTIAITRPTPSSTKEERMVCACPLTATADPRGNCGRMSSTNELIFAPTLPRSLPCTLTYTSTAGVKLYRDTTASWAAGATLTKLLSNCEAPPAAVGTGVRSSESTLSFWYC